MKKSSSRESLGLPVRHQPRAGRSAARKVEHWAFNLATESLFALGSGRAVWRVAYRKNNGDLRFLPH